jgi:cytochrome c oxidase subunit 3
VVFLSTEILFFEGCCQLIVYCNLHPAGFVAEATSQRRLGAVNTAVLICSSFTMAMAVHSAQLGKRRALTVFLILTMLLGLVSGNQVQGVLRSLRTASVPASALPAQTSVSN